MSAPQNANHRKWVEEQEERYKSILDKIQYLAQFDKFDNKTGVLSKGILLVKVKMPRAEFVAKLTNVHQHLKDMERDPINLFMMSQYATRRYSLEKMRAYVTALKGMRRHILNADEEEPEHIPHIIRREFYLMDLVMSGLMLRDWRRILGCEDDGTMQGIAIEEEGGRVVDGSATAAQAVVVAPLPRPESAPQLQASHQASNMSIMGDPDEDEMLNDPFIDFDDDMLSTVRSTHPSLPSGPSTVPKIQLVGVVPSAVPPPQTAVGATSASSSSSSSSSSASSSPSLSPAPSLLPGSRTPLGGAREFPVLRPKDAGLASAPTSGGRPNAQSGRSSAQASPESESKRPIKSLPPAASAPVVHIPRLDVEHVASANISDRSAYSTSSVASSASPPRTIEHPSTAASEVGSGSPPPEPNPVVSVTAVQHVAPSHAMPTYFHGRSSSWGADSSSSGRLSPDRSTLMQPDTTNKSPLNVCVSPPLGRPAESEGSSSKNTTPRTPPHSLPPGMAGNYRFFHARSSSDERQVILPAHRRTLSGGWLDKYSTPEPTVPLLPEKSLSKLRPVKEAPVARSLASSLGYRPRPIEERIPASASQERWSPSADRLLPDDRRLPFEERRPHREERWSPTMSNSERGQPLSDRRITEERPGLFEDRIFVSDRHISEDRSSADYRLAEERRPFEERRGPDTVRLERRLSEDRRPLSSRKLSARQRPVTMVDEPLRRPASVSLHYSKY